eukprot:TRINITY_DN24352_c0_g5_i1.p1 TRINITY_DN24352_c0_g5~~TRINITY_DN24352_c0_g5_i1.p1  ORF type:complete len:960 (-),score=157.09 TRINITY_DN24352_c0_g5_i1:69-2948(-)
MLTHGFCNLGSAEALGSTVGTRRSNGLDCSLPPSMLAAEVEAALLTRHGSDASACRRSASELLREQHAALCRRALAGAVGAVEVVTTLLASSPWARQHAGSASTAASATERSTTSSSSNAEKIWCLGAAAPVSSAATAMVPGAEAQALGAGVSAPRSTAPKAASSAAAKNKQAAEATSIRAGNAAQRTSSLAATRKAANSANEETQSQAAEASAPSTSVNTLSLDEKITANTRALEAVPTSTSHADHAVAAEIKVSANAQSCASSAQTLSDAESFEAAHSANQAVAVPSEATSLLGDKEGTAVNSSETTRTIPVKAVTDETISEAISEKESHAGPLAADAAVEFMKQKARLTSTAESKVAVVCSPTKQMNAPPIVLSASATACSQTHHVATLRAAPSVADVPTTDFTSTSSVALGDHVVGGSLEVTSAHVVRSIAAGGTCTTQSTAAISVILNDAPLEASPTTCEVNASSREPIEAVADAQTSASTLLATPKSPSALVEPSTAASVAAVNAGVNAVSCVQFATATMSLSTVANASASAEASVVSDGTVDVATAPRDVVTPTASSTPAVTPAPKPALGRPATAMELWWQLGAGNGPAAFAAGAAVFPWAQPSTSRAATPVAAVARRRVAHGRATNSVAAAAACSGGKSALVEDAQLLPRSRAASRAVSASGETVSAHRSRGQPLAHATATASLSARTACSDAAQAPARAARRQAADAARCDCCFCVNAIPAAIRRDTACALKVGEDDDVVVPRFGLLRGQLRCLRPKCWLNDQVINSCFRLVQEHCVLSGCRCWCPNSFFWSFLSGSDEKTYNYARVQRWTNRARVDVFALDYVIFPMNVGGKHWATGAIDVRRKGFWYFDSLGRSPSLNFVSFLQRYVSDEHAARRGSPLVDVEKWALLHFGSPVPLQRNGYDCGVFACVFAEHLAGACGASNFCRAASAEKRLQLAARILSGGGESNG